MSLRRVLIGLGVITPHPYWRWVRIEQHDGTLLSCWVDVDTGLVVNPWRGRP